ncbi:unnamed protein product, partial [marine sediment metagenome]
EQIKQVLTAQGSGLEEAAFLRPAGAEQGEWVGTNFERKYLKQKKVNLHHCREENPVRAIHKPPIAELLKKDLRRSCPDCVHNLSNFLVLNRCGGIIAQVFEGENDPAQRQSE